LTRCGYPAQIDNQVGDVLIAVLRGLGKRFGEDTVEFHWKPAPQGGHRLGLSMNDAKADRLVGFAGKGEAAREHFKKHDSDGPDVGAAIGG
jgi:hypothetical protein